jgi:fused signal recognition particle receptor
MNFFKKLFTKEKKEDLEKGLEKTKSSFFDQITKAVAGKSTVDESFLDELEGILISADVGLDTTVKIIDRLQARVSKDKYINTSELNQLLKSEIVNILSENKTDDYDNFIPENHPTPYIIMVVGVNGVGKTTTIGKLAYHLTMQRKRVVLGAADTFRAAAVDQLKLWADRNDVEFYGKGMNADPASVAFEATQYALTNKCDVAIIDTAGRLHNKVNLMAELSKIKKSIGKAYEGAPHEVILVLDATTGQNAIEQAKAFTAATEVTALALTKLDGTAKGGVVLGISDQFKIPIKYIGVGEGIDKLQVFNKEAFVNALFGGKSE